MNMTAPITLFHMKEWFISKYQLVFELHVKMREKITKKVFPKIPNIGKPPDGISSKLHRTVLYIVYICVKFQSSYRVSLSTIKLQIIVMVESGWASSQLSVPDQIMTILCFIHHLSSSNIYTDVCCYDFYKHEAAEVSQKV